MITINRFLFFTIQCMNSQQSAVKSYHLPINVQKHSTLTSITLIIIALKLRRSNPKTVRLLRHTFNI